MPRLLDYLNPVYAFLAAIDPSLPRALFVAAIFGAVLLWRKISPDTWRAYSNLIPVSDEQTGAFVKVLKKTWQALPSVLMSAIAGALGTGGNVGATVKVTVLGLLPPIIHELGWRYTGQLGDGKPLVPPSLPNSGRGEHIHLAPPDDDPGPDTAAEMRGGWRLSLATLAFALAGCSLLGNSKPLCDESRLGAVDTEFLAAVAKSCLKYSSATECPEYPKLKAKHSRDLKEICQ